MKYKAGDIVRGKRTGRKIEIIRVENGFYRYRDLKYGTIFNQPCKVIDNCNLEKVN